MRAIQQLRLEGPDGTELVDLPDPTPAESEVLVRVAYGALNFPDVLLSHGKYQFKPPPPFTLGGEFAGVVEAVGEKVTSFRPGDRVAGTMIHGAFAEFLVVSPEMLVPIPDGVSLELASATLLTHLTTMHALVDRANLQKRESLLVLGAAGGVGTAAITLGKMLGARVIAAASTEDKLALCKKLGADDTIQYTNEDLKERVKALTGGSGVDVIYDAVGGPHAEQALRAIAWEGRYLVVGFASGEIPKIPLNLTLLKGCQIMGVFWGSFAMREPAKNRAHAERVFEAIAKGVLAPEIDSVVDAKDARAALVRMENRDVKGKLVLRF